MLKISDVFKDEFVEITLEQDVVHKKWADALEHKHSGKRLHAKVKRDWQRALKMLKPIKL